MTSDARPPVARASRLLALSVSAAPVFMLVAVLFVVPADGTELSVPVLLAVLAGVGAGFVLAETLGYRAEPLPPGLSEAEARRRSLVTFQSRQMIRLLFTEAPVIAAIALTFVLDEGPWPMVVATAAGVPSMLFHLVPTRRGVDRLGLALESGGARSYLPEALEA